MELSTGTRRTSADTWSSVSHYPQALGLLTGRYQPAPPLALPPGVAGVTAVHEAFTLDVCTLAHRALARIASITVA